MTFTALPKRLDITYSANGSGYQKGNVKLVVGGGSDIVRVYGTATQAITSLYTIGGNATISVVTTAGAANTLLGTLSIDAGAAPAQFIFYEAGSTTADNLVITPNRMVSTVSNFAINYVGTFSRGFLVYTGQANDQVTVLGTSPGAYTYINTGGGADQVTVNVTGPSTDPLIIDGGDGGVPAGNVLFVNDALGGAAAFLFPTGLESGAFRLAYPNGLRDVYFLSIDNPISNPAAS
jgi:hypothetical protein